MLERLGRLAVRWRAAILALALAGAGIAGAAGGGVAGELTTSGGFVLADQESAQAAAALERLFNQHNPNLILLVTAKNGSVDDPDVAAEAAALTQRLAREPGVTQVTSYWNLGRPEALRSQDRRQALVMARILGSDDAAMERVAAIAPRFQQEGPATAVQVGGTARLFLELSEQVERDLVRAESISLPITLLLLVLAFGSVVAGGLPLVLGILAILGNFLLLRGLARVTDISVYALNLTFAMGLGLAIDYSLLLVSRYREELRSAPPHEAVVRTVRTAGRTVLFSAATVIASLAALLVFPLGFLRSMGLAGIGVVAIAALAAVAVLPALLAVLGRRVDWLQVLPERRAAGGSGGFWHRTATVVMRRPLPIALVVTGLLLALGAPFLGIRWGIPDDRALPATASSRQVMDAIRERFPAMEAGALSVVAEHAGDPRALAGALDRYAAALSRLPGAARVEAATGSYAAGRRIAPPGPAARRFTAGGATWLSVVPAVEPISPDGEQLVRDVRALAAPFEVRVGGPSAELLDQREAMFRQVPLAAGLIALATFVLLFLLTGSVLLPLKAAVLNLLSLTATFGSLVWVFQEGNLAGLLDFTPGGTIEITMPVLMFCMAFGLSMDYEVFMLSRIKEEHDRRGDTVSAVAAGLQRTGRIVTQAAALLAVVFIAIGTSEVRYVKMLGLGMALAVIVDATLVRALLVPAAMRLAGRANWWAPRPLRRLHERFGLREAPLPEPAAGGTVP